MKYLLDTNIVIFLLKGRMEVAQAIDSVGIRNCVISEITKAELLVGYYKALMKGRNPSPKLFEFLDALTVIPISSSLDIFARELARLQMEGCVIDDFDLLIGATAVSNGFILVTDNVAHLGRIKGVVTENWIQRVAVGV